MLPNNVFIVSASMLLALSATMLCGCTVLSGCTECNCSDPKTNAGSSKSMRTRRHTSHASSAPHTTVDAGTTSHHDHSYSPEPPKAAAFRKKWESGEDPSDDRLVQFDSGVALDLFEVLKRDERDESGRIVHSSTKVVPMANIDLAAVRCEDSWQEIPEKMKQALQSILSKMAKSQADEPRVFPKITPQFVSGVMWESKMASRFEALCKTGQFMPERKPTEAPLELRDDPPQHFELNWATAKNTPNQTPVKIGTFEVNLFKNLVHPITAEQRTFPYAFVQGATIKCPSGRRTLTGDFAAAIALEINKLAVGTTVVDFHTAKGAIKVPSVTFEAVAIFDWSTIDQSLAVAQCSEPEAAFAGGFASRSTPAHAFKHNWATAVPGSDSRFIELEGPRIDLFTHLMKGEELRVFPSFVERGMSVQCPGKEGNFALEGQLMSVTMQRLKAEYNKYWNTHPRLKCRSNQFMLDNGDLEGAWYLVQSSGCGVGVEIALLNVREDNTLKKKAREFCENSPTRLATVDVSDAEL